MVTVLIECKDAELPLARTLAALVSGAVEGLIREVVVLDGGSMDGTLGVADAAGCSLYRQWNMGEVIAKARGAWLLVLEAGARPQAGWIGEVGEYMIHGRHPAAFSPSTLFNKPLLKRVFGQSTPLEYGLLLKKPIETVASDMALSDFVRGRAKRLRSEIIPAWAVS